MSKNSVTVKISEDLLAYIDAEVSSKRGMGIKWDKSKEVITALQQRRISKMPRHERDELYRRLGMTGKNKNGRTDDNEDMPTVRGPQNDTGNDDGRTGDLPGMQGRGETGRTGDANSAGDPGTES